MKNKKVMMLVVGSVALLLLIGLIIGFFVIGVKNNSVEGITNKLMRNYQKLDDDVVEKIKYDYDDKLSSSQRDKYKEIIKKQYKNMEYDISSSEVDGPITIVTVEFSVYDLGSSMNRANSYVDLYEDRFIENGEFNEEKAIDYKLSELEETDERIDYSIEIRFHKEDGKFIMSELTETDLKKLDGTY